MTDAILNTSFTADANQAKATVEKLKRSFESFELSVTRLNQKFASFSAVVQKIGAGTQSLQKSASNVNWYQKALDSLAKQGPSYTKAFQDLVKGIDQTSKANRQAAKTVMEVHKNLTSVRAAYADYLKNVHGATAGTKKYQQEMARLSNLIMLSKASLAGFSGLVKNTTSSLANWIGTTNQSTRSFQRFVTLLNAHGGSIKKLSAYYQQLAQHAQNAGEASKSATSGVAAGTKAMKDQVGTIEKVIQRLKEYAKFVAAATALYGFINSIRVAREEIVEYDQALKNIEAISGAFSFEVSAMSETMKQIARDTKFSTTEIASGMVLLSQSGYSAEEALDAINSVAALATGTLSDMQTATDLLTTATRAFSLSAKESGRIADVFANAINRSKLTVDKLRIAMNYIGVSAAQAGLTLEETAASMMVLANNGLRASTIGTGLRQVIAKLLSPTAEMASSLSLQGVELSKLNPKLVGYQKVLENLSRVLWDNQNQAVNMAKAYDLFKLRGAQAAASLVKSWVKVNDTGSFKGMLEVVQRVGTAQEMMGIQAEGLGVKLKNLADRARNVALAIGEAGLTKAIHVAVDGLREFVILVERFISSPFGALTTQLAMMSASAVALQKIGSAIKSMFGGALIVSLIKLEKNLYRVIKATSLSTAAFWLWRKAWLKHPAAIVSVAIGTLVLTIGKLITYTERSAEAASEAAVRYRQTAEAVRFYADKLATLASDPSEEYANMIKRIASESPELDKQLKQTAGVVDLATLSFSELAKAMKEVDLKNIGAEMESVAKALDKYGKGMSWFKEKAEEVSSPFVDAITSFVMGYDRTIDSLKEKTKQYEDNMVGAVQTLTLLATRYGQTKEEVKAYVDELRLSPKVAEDLVNRTYAAIDRANSAIPTYVESFRDSIRMLPFAYRKAFDDMAATDRVSFVDFQRTLNDKVSEFRKNARMLNLSEAEMSQAAAALMAKKYAEWAIQNSRTLDAIEDREGKSVEIIKGFIDQTVKEYRRGAIDRREAEGRFSGYTQVINEKYVEGIRRTYNDAVTIIKTSLGKLRTEYERLQAGYEDTSRSILSAQESYHESLRDIQQRTMTDEEKWLDDRKEANRLLSQGMEKNDEDMLRRAQSIFKSLAREVKNANGETVANIETTSEAAKAGMAKAQDALVGVLEAQRQKFKDGMVEVRGQIDATEARLERYRNKLVEISNTPFKLNTSQLERTYTELAAFVKRFRGLAEQDAEVNIRFTGEGSDKKLITEKTAEVRKDVGDTVSELDGQVATVRVDVESEKTDFGKPIQAAEITIPAKVETDEGRSVDEELDRVEARLDETIATAKRDEIPVTADFRASDSSGGRSIPSTIDMIKVAFKGLTGYISAGMGVYRVLIAGDPDQKPIITTISDTIDLVKNTTDTINRQRPVFKALFQSGDGSDLSAAAEDAVNSTMQAKDTIGNMVATFRTAFTDIKGGSMTDAIASLIVDSGYLENQINSASANFKVAFSDEQGVSIGQKSRDLIGTLTGIAGQITGLAPIFGTRFETEGQSTFQKTISLIDKVRSAAGIINSIAAIFNVSFMGHASSARPLTEKIAEITKKVVDFAKNVASRGAEFVMSFLTDRGQPLVDGLGWIWDKVSEFASRVGSTIISFSAEIVSGGIPFGDYIDQAISGIRRLSDMAIGSVIEFAGGIFSGGIPFGDYIDLTREKVWDFIEFVRGAAAGLVVRFIGDDGIAKPIGETFANVWQWVRETVAFIGRAVAEFTTNFLSGDGQPLVKAIEWIKDGLGDLSRYASGFKSLIKIGLVAKDDDTPILKKIWTITKELGNFRSIIKALGPTLKIWFKARGVKEDLKDGIDEATDMVSGFSKHVADNASDLLVNFLGHGSATRWLSDKVSEMREQVGDFGAEVSEMRPRLDLDFSGIMPTARAIIEFLVSMLERLGDSVGGATGDAIDRVLDMKDRFIGSFDEIAKAVATRTEIIERGYTSTFDRMIGKTKDFGAAVRTGVVGAIEAYNDITSKVRGVANIVNAVFIGDKEQDSLIDSTINAYETVKKTSEKISGLRTLFRVMMGASNAGEDGEKIYPFSKTGNMMVSDAQKVSAAINAMQTSFTAIFTDGDGIPLGQALKQTMQHASDAAVGISSIFAKFRVRFEADDGLSFQEKIMDIMDQSSDLSSLIGNLGTTFESDFLSADGLPVTSKISKVGNAIGDLADMINGLVPSFKVEMTGHGSDEKPISEKIAEVFGKLTSLATNISKTISKFVTKFVDERGNLLSKAIEKAKGGLGRLKGYVEGSYSRFRVFIGGDDGRGILDWIEDTFKGLRGLQDFIRATKAIFTIDFWTNEGGTFDEQIEHIKKRAQLVADFINNIIANFKVKFANAKGIDFGKIVDWVKGVFKNVARAIGDIVGEFSTDITIGGYSLEDGINWAKKMFLALYEFVKGMVVTAIARFTDSDGTPVLDSLEEVKEAFRKTSDTVGGMRTLYKIFVSDESGSMSLADKLSEAIGSAEKTSKTISGIKTALKVGMMAERSGLPIPEALKENLGKAKAFAAGVRRIKSILTLGIAGDDGKPIEDELESIIDTVGWFALKFNAVGDMFRIDMGKWVGKSIESTKLMAESVSANLGALARSVGTLRFSLIAKKVGDFSLSLAGMKTALVKMGPGLAGAAAKFNVFIMSAQAFITGIDVGAMLRKSDMFGLLPKTIGEYAEDYYGILDKLGILGPQKLQFFIHDMVSQVEKMGGKIGVGIKKAAASVWGSGKGFVTSLFNADDAEKAAGETADRITATLGSIPDQQADMTIKFRGEGYSDDPADRLGNIYRKLTDQHESVMGRIGAGMTLVRIAFTGSDGTDEIGEGQSLGKTIKMAMSNVKMMSDYVGRIKTSYRIIFGSGDGKSIGDKIKDTITNVRKSAALISATNAFYRIFVNTEEPDGRPLVDLSNLIDRFIDTGRKIGNIKSKFTTYLMADSGIGLGRAFDWASRGFESLGDSIAKIAPDFIVNFFDDEQAPLSDRWSRVKHQAGKLKEYFEKAKAAVIVAFKSDDGSPLIDRILEAGLEARRFFEQLHKTAATIFVAITGRIGQKVYGSLHDAVMAAFDIGESLRKRFISGARYIIDFATPDGSKIEDALHGMLNVFSVWIETIQSRLRHAFDVAFLGKALNEGLVDGLKRKTSDVIDGIEDRINGITAKVKVFFTGEGSTEKPITEKADEVQKLLGKFGEGIQSTAKMKFSDESGRPITDAARDMAGRVIDIFSNVASAAKEQYPAEFVSNITDGLVTIGNAAQTVLKNIGGGDKTIFQKLFGDISATGATEDRFTRLTASLYNTYDNFFDGLNSLQRIDFSNFYQSTQSKVKAYVESAKAMSATEEEMTATIARIRKNEFERYKKQVEDEGDILFKAGIERVVEDIDKKVDRINAASDRVIEGYQGRINKLEMMKIDAETKFLKSQVGALSIKDSALYKSLNESIGVLSEMSQKEIAVAKASHAEKVKLYLESMSQDERFIAGKQAFLDSLGQSAGNYWSMTEKEIAAAKKRNIELAKAYNVDLGQKSFVGEADLRAAMTYADKIRAIQVEMAEERVNAIKKGLGISIVLLDDYASKEKAAVAESVGARKRGILDIESAERQSMTARERLDAEYAVEREKFWNLNLQMAKEKGIDMVELERAANVAKKQLYDEDIRAREAAESVVADVVGSGTKEAGKVYKAYSNQIKGLDKAVLEEKKKRYKEARESLKKELDASLELEKQVAEEIKGVYKDMADERKSTDEKIRDLRRGLMTDEQAYNDEWNEINEKISRAVSLGNDQYEEKIALLKEAKNQAAGMAKEVKDGDKVIISQKSATEKAIKSLERIQGLMGEASKVRVAVLEKSRKDIQENTKDIQDTLEAVDTRLQAITDRLGKDVVEGFDKIASRAESFMESLKKGTKFEIDTDEAERKLDALIKKAKEIGWVQTKDTPLKFASGGAVPGAGDQDTVPAMLTPGEHVIDKWTVSALGGHGFFNWIRSRTAPIGQIRAAIADAVGSIKVGPSKRPVIKSHAPKFSFPVQHFAAGGAVNGVSPGPDFGTITLAVPGASLKASGPIDDVKRFRDYLTKEKRMKPNDFTLGRR